MDRGVSEFYQDGGDQKGMLPGHNSGKRIKHQTEIQIIMVLKGNTVRMKTIEEFRLSAIEMYLALFGTKTKVAELLGIGRSTLHRNLETAQSKIPDVDQSLHTLGLSDDQINPVRKTIKIYDETGRLRSLEQLEADFLEFAEYYFGGNITLICEQLQIGRSTYYRRTKKAS